MTMKRNVKIRSCRSCRRITRFINHTVCECCGHEVGR